MRRLADLGLMLLSYVKALRSFCASVASPARINKVLEGRPHAEDAIRNRQVQIVFKTTDGQTAVSDPKSQRRATLMQKGPYYTTLAGAAAVAEAIAAFKAGSLEVRRRQGHF